MPLTFHIDIASPEGLIFSGRAAMVIAPTAMGEIGVLARHAPLLARLRPGPVRVLLDGGNEREESFFVSGGFIEVQPHMVTILADTTVRTRDLDEAAARAAVARIEKQLNARSLSADEYERLKQELQLSTELLRTISRLGMKKK